MDSQKSQSKHHFMVSGQIEYLEGGETKLAKSNALYKAAPPAPNERLGAARINVKGVAEIQTALQMHFFNKYMRTHPAPPEITDVVIENISYLGAFTDEEFLEGASKME